MPARCGVASRENDCPLEAPTTPAQIAKPVPARRMENVSTALLLKAGESFARMAMTNSVKSIAIQVNTSPRGLSIKTASRPSAVSASAPNQDDVLLCDLRAGEVNITAAANPLRLKAYSQENEL